MALISSLFPSIAPYVPGCPDPMLEQEIRSAAQEYFQRTSAWIDWLAEITTVANTRQYVLTLPADSEVHRIERATLDTNPIEIKVWRTVSPNPDGNVTGSNGLVSEDRTNVLLSGNPTAGQKLQVQAVLVPTDTATAIPDALWSRHKSKIAEGAKYRLMRVPGALHKPREAQEASDLFEKAIASMAVETWRSHTSVTPRAKAKWC
jgi:hypothetical protein